MTSASTATPTPDTTGVSGVGAVAETPTPAKLAASAWTATGTAAVRGASADYHRWLDHVHAAAGCSAPVRLAGRVHTHTVNTTTGQITGSHTAETANMPDGTIYKACGNRRSSVCPSCAETYRADAYQLVLAGLRGGKTIPETVGKHPAMFATLTGPSFGLVHTQGTTSKGKPTPCRARRAPDMCPHGVDLRCSARHQDGDHWLGQPLCRDCYDYDHHAVWNLHAGELWRRTTISLHRKLHQYAHAHGYTVPVTDAATGRTRYKTLVRVSFGKVAEFQRRGVVHFHVLARFDGIDPADPNAIVAPPEWANGFLLATLLRQAGEDTRYRTASLVVDDHHGHRVLDHPDGFGIGWGEQLDTRPVRVSGEESLTPERVADELHTATRARHQRGRLLSKQGVAGYLAKYATKATETTGHTSRRLTSSTVDLYADESHPGRIIAAAWRLGYGGHLDPAKDATWYPKLRRWAHMLGFGGHFFSKSRRYTTTFARLRQARVDYRRAHYRTAEHLELAEDEALVRVAELAYVGTGWHTTGDAMLANTAAALARERRRTGREETTTSA